MHCVFGSSPSARRAATSRASSASDVSVRSYVRIKLLGGFLGGAQALGHSAAMVRSEVLFLSGACRTDPSPAPSSAPPHSAGLILS